jgi:predicted nucleic acid-binding protein
MMRKLRVFVDTSVFGGCFDEEFERHSKQFFEEVRSGRFGIVVSETVLAELKGAPDCVKELVAELAVYSEVIAPDPDIAVLRDAYINAGIVGKSSFDDAEHIAVASVERVDLVVSWNFKHIVHFDKIKGYNAINMLKGYQSIDIRSPSEVIDHETKNV